MGDINQPPTTTTTSDNEESWEKNLDLNKEAQIIPNVEDTVDVNVRFLNQQPAYDIVINSQVQI